jgi:transcriptional regulator with XRE-family HTH domain
MADKDLQQLRQVIDQAVQASRMLVRDVEKAMGLGHGYLNRLLDGKVEIKVRHIVGLAAVLKVPPGDFLELGFPEASRTAEHRLADWISPPGSASRTAAAASGELRDAVRAAVYQELAALGIKPPEPGKD